MFVLAADIGGTCARFRLLEATQHGRRTHHEAELPSGEFPGLSETVEHYLSQLSRAERADIEGAWLGVAGPVQNKRVRFTNLPWIAEADTLCAQLGLREVHLINDLEALAHAIPTLQNHQLMTLQPGTAGAAGPRVVIAVGTGLGVAALVRNSTGHYSFASEGGHADFAPCNETQLELLHHLKARFEHVSYERVLSGNGLNSLYQFQLLKGERQADVQATPLSPPQIVEAADYGTDPEALAAIETFVETLGAFAGNVALQWLATGGLYLTGGVATQLHPYLTGPSFSAAFQNKGRMREMMTRIPVSLIMERHAGLEGISEMAVKRYRAGETMGG